MISIPLHFIGKGGRVMVMSNAVSAVTDPDEERWLCIYQHGDGTPWFVDAYYDDVVEVLRDLALDLPIDHSHDYSFKPRKAKVK